MALARGEMALFCTSCLNKLYTLLFDFAISYYASTIWFSHNLLCETFSVYHVNNQIEVYSEITQTPYDIYMLKERWNKSNFYRSYLSSDYLAGMDTANIAFFVEKNPTSLCPIVHLFVS
jgi:hypothetical protein